MSHRTEPVAKVCPSCGQEFKVCPPGKASRTYPKNTQVFCSVPCARKARYRNGTQANILTPEQAAYIAGFLDGEGSVILYMRRDTVALRVTFANTNRHVLEWIQEHISVGNIIGKPRRIGSNHKVGFMLLINSDSALTLLTQVLPYLIIKREQAQIAIDFQNSLHIPSRKADRPWQYAVRAKMQALNKRGI